MSTSRDSSKRKPPIGLKWRSNTFFILCTVGMGLFTDLFLYGLVVPLLPFILKQRINVPQGQIQSYTSTLLAVYAGSSVFASLPVGILSDQFATRQLPYLAGLFSLFLATLLFFITDSIAIVILARVLQGLSAAVVWTVGLAMVRDTVGIKNLGVTIGGVFSVISIGELAAPVLGGVIFDKAGEHAVAAVAGGVLAIDFIMRILIIEKKTAKKFEIDDDTETGDEEEGRTRNGDRSDSHHQDEDPANADEEEEPSEDSPLLHLGNRKSNDPDSLYRFPSKRSKLIEAFPLLYCFTSARLLTAELLTFILAFLFAVSDATLPTEAQDLFDIGPLTAGLLFIPIIFPYLLLGALAGHFVDKYGGRPAAVIGMFYLVPIYVLLRIPKAGGKEEMIKFVAILAAVGVGMAIISAPAVVEANETVERFVKVNPEIFTVEPWAQLFAINSMVYSAGLALGPVVSGSLREAIGYGNMNAVVAGICGVMGVLSFLFLGRRGKRQESS